MKCPAHPKIIEGLRNVELFFLPPNTTSKIQPCDAGIIRALKAHYRRRFYASILEGHEVGATNPEKINILDAINHINAAWNIDVKSSTLANCFRHCKIRSDPSTILEPQVEDDGIRGLSEVISDLRYRDVMNVDHLLNYPNENDTVMESPTDEEIIEGIMNPHAEEDHDPDDSCVIPIVSPKEALEAVTTLNNFLLQNEKNFPNVVHALQKIKDEVKFGLDGKKKQATIEKIEIYS